MAIKSVIRVPRVLILPHAVNEKDVILDVRRRPGARKIRGAQRYNRDTLLCMTSAPPIPRDRRIVIDAETRADAEEVADHLAALGFKAVYILFGGFEAWQLEGRPTEEAADGL